MGGIELQLFREYCKYDMMLTILFMTYDCLHDLHSHTSRLLVVDLKGLISMVEISNLRFFPHLKREYLHDVHDEVYDLSFDIKLPNACVPKLINLGKYFKPEK